MRRAVDIRFSNGPVFHTRSTSLVEALLNPSAQTPPEQSTLPDGDMASVDAASSPCRILLYG
ncbi:hypothetical protein DPMN_157525 [Dreissena polymorpha]|uniref:Uncharacterized protein n=1 Tax=Dreissena polymorpha TaxID=45954 RepID=A0A9D4IQ31_DREPO|nr:hypothetical protein DPMN_157525 [Dreissena polymorpha]